MWGGLGAASLRVENDTSSRAGVERLRTHSPRLGLEGAPRARDQTEGHDGNDQSQGQSCLRCFVVLRPKRVEDFP